MTGHLSHQIEHHLFPDLPAHRYAEIADDVRAVCDEHGLPYNTGSLAEQFGSVVRRIGSLALPGREDEPVTSRLGQLVGRLNPLFALDPAAAAPGTGRAYAAGGGERHRRVRRGAAMGTTSRIRVLLVGMAMALALGLVAPMPATAETPPSPDDLWVQAAYRTLLHREPTLDQRRHRLAQLEAGRTHVQIATELAESREHAVVIVDRIYALVLGRAPDPASRAYWRERVVQGTVIRPTALLFASDEYAAAHGGTVEGYLTGIYEDLMGRAPDQDGLAYWTGRLEAGLSRTDFVLFLAARSHEVYRGRGARLILELLDRPAATADADYWGRRLARSDEPPIEAVVVATAEFRARAQAGQIG